MMGGLLVIDGVVSGSTHVPFNAGLLAALAAIEGAGRITFHAEARHRSEVLALLPPRARARIGGASLPAGLVARRPGASELLDAALGALLGRGAALPRDARLILPTTTRASLLSLALLTLRGRLARGQGFAVLHAVLAQLWAPRARHPLRRAVDLESALRCAGAFGHHPVLLEPGIASAFAARLPALADLACLWPHPLPPPLVASAQVTPISAEPARQQPRLGFLGWATEEKGFAGFLAAARAFAGQAEFHAIAHVKPDDAACNTDDAPLATRPRRAPWPRAAFERQAATLDFLCLFHEGPLYRHVASGVLIDALALAIPVIAPRIPLIAALARRHGEIGILYEDAAARPAAIQSALALVGSPRHAAMRRNLAAAAAARRPAALAPRIAADLAVPLP
jgi:hypothetical protein